MTPQRLHHRTNTNEETRTAAIKLITQVPFDHFKWPAKWIWAPGSYAAFDVVQFSKCFKAGPQRLHVSADNRYKLYIDGKLIGLGPQRGDTQKWFFDTYDINLPQDETVHVITAVVWHDRDTAPFAQISFRPAFLLAAEGPDAQKLGTDHNWRCRRWLRNKTIPVIEEAFSAMPGFDTSGFTNEDLQPSPDQLENDFCSSVELGLAFYARDHRAKYCDLPWRLHPRTIPALKCETNFIGIYRHLQIESTVRIDLNNFRTAIDNLISPDCNSNTDTSVTIPENSECSILIDRKELVVGYPQLVVSHGAGSTVTITYQEALQSALDDVTSKGHRDDIKERFPIGIYDTFRPDGRDHVIFEPFWYRCWRYIQIEIQTALEPIVLHSLEYRSTGYPLQLNASIDAPKHFTPLLEPGFRTLSLCAGETYMDCPYYEQLQYLGDTRIQALATYLLSGDDRLARQAVDAFDRSRLADGLTQSRYPCYNSNRIPVFSLLQIDMLLEFLMWQGDYSFVLQYMLGVESILHGFERFLKPNGLVGEMKGWAFVDWVNACGWQDGIPPQAETGDSFLVSFLYLYALQQGAKLYRLMDDTKHAEEFSTKAQQLQKDLIPMAFDSTRNIFIDAPSGQQISQHTNILAILTNSCSGIISPTKLLQQILSHDNRFASVSYYFSFYLFEAMYHIGRADLIIPTLKPWHAMIANGLTTFAETPEPTRSDCHAWSVHPLYHFFASVLGVRPVKPGCKEITINPMPRHYIPDEVPDCLSGTFITPQGLCVIKLNAQDNIYDIQAELPDNIIVS